MAASLVAVWPTVAQAKAAYSAIAARAVLDCMAKVMTKGANGKKSEHGRLSFPRIGNASVARQIKTTVQGVDVFVDIVIFRQGRAVVLLLFGDAFGPFSPYQEVEFARKVAARGQGQ